VGVQLCRGERGASFLCVHYCLIVSLHKGPPPPLKQKYKEELYSTHALVSLLPFELDYSACLGESTVPRRGGVDVGKRN
jgi:hypothetical protein